MNAKITMRSYYIRFLCVTLPLIWAASSVQQQIAYGGIQSRFFLMPTVIGAVIALLLARLSYLQAQSEYKSQQFQAMADFAFEFTYYRTLDGAYEYVSRSCEKITGYSEEEFYQKPNLMDELIHPEDMSRWKGHIHAINNKTDKPQALEIRIIKKDGSVVWIEHMCSPAFDDRGEQVGVRSTNLDITKRREAEQDIWLLAYFDPLTNLPNRRSLEQEIIRRIREAGRFEGFAILFLDMRRFKNINDSFGHEFGDKLLKALATRLLEIDPSLFVSRFGGDEFVIIAPGVETDEEALFLAQTILDKVELPIKLESIELVVSASLGISFYPRDGQDVGTLISRADTAMYRMKSERELQASIYSGVVSDQLSYFVSTENSIYKGIQERQFTNYYQPKVDMETGRIIGLEALIRWQHPDQGMVLPGRFIDVAEETGQIVEIGRMVLERTMHDIKEWMKAGVAVPVSVNVSARQFIGQMFTEQCMRRFDTREIEPSLVSLEVTEQVFLGDLENAKRQLQRFRDMGVSIALDDFGTGYSSLSYLMQLPIDTLKIDKSFIEDICIDERSRAILKVILGISNELGLSVVAEGVETDEQRRLLREMDCKVAQGFYFYKPMPANEIRALLVGQRARAMARPTFSRANYKPN